MLKSPQTAVPPMYTNTHDLAIEGIEITEADKEKTPYDCVQVALDIRRQAVACESTVWAVERRWLEIYAVAMRLKMLQPLTP
jgi:hypothetical protein